MTGYLAYNTVTKRYWDGAAFSIAPMALVRAKTLSAGELAVLRATYQNTASTSFELEPTQAERDLACGQMIMALSRGWAKTGGAA